MVALDGNALTFENTTNADGSIVYTQTTFIGPWDLFYFILFNRFLFLLQSDRVNLWRYTTGLPSLPWYLGEVFLDSYPFQKAWAVTGRSMWLKIVAATGFVPLVVYKSGLIIFRYYYSVKAAKDVDYFRIFNYLDAGAITLAAWNDVLSCFVIVYIGWKVHSGLQSTETSVLSNLVKTTELRIILCTILSVLSAVLMFQEGCIGDVSSSKGCVFSNVRNIAIDIVYGLYYLDYLIIKYYKVVSSEKTLVKGTSNRDQFEPSIGYPHLYNSEIDVEMVAKKSVAVESLITSTDKDLRFRSMTNTSSQNGLSGLNVLGTGSAGTSYGYGSSISATGSISTLYNPAPKFKLTEIQRANSNGFQSNY
ncbi:hypothetical protein HK096_009696 [Nowakowskiella sp. JEL0078]|nr:hypothetical protein HK096_009696 [Nowakowskiella sp. JEL0078]